MELRPARAADVDAIVALAPDLGRAWLDERLAAPDPIPSVVIASGDEGRVEGFVAVDADNDHGRIVALVVAPDLRRGGHGRKLLVCAERTLARAHCRRATIAAPTPNAVTGNAATGSAAGDDAAALFLTAMGWERSADHGWTAALTDGGAERTHLVANRWSWNDAAPDFEGPGRTAYQPERRASPTWGCWGVPESDVGMLREVADRDVVELGCGTGYVSAWCLEAGARSVVGIDNSPRQLATARALQDEFGVRFPVVFGDAERTPFPDASFDLAISEYGAAIWCDPYRWIPEAARLLRPGGRLAFLGGSVVSSLCVLDYEAEGEAGPTMIRPQHDMHRFAWLDDLGVEFHISHGAMIRLLRDSGFEILDLVELYVPETPGTRHNFTVSAEWGRQWPVEEVWLAERVG